MLFATIALWFALGVTALMAAPTNNANATLPVVALDCGQTPTVCAALCDWFTQSNDCIPATLSLDKAKHDQELAIRGKTGSKDGARPQRICYRDQVKARHNLGQVKARHDHLLRCGDCRDYTGSGECEVSFPPTQSSARGLVARANASPEESNTYHDQLDGLFAGKSDGWSFIAAVSNFDSVSQCQGAGYQSTPRTFVGNPDCLKKQPSSSNDMVKTRRAPIQTHQYTLEDGTKVLARGLTNAHPRDVFLMDGNHPDGGIHKRVDGVKAVPMPPFIGPRRSNDEHPSASAAVATTLEAGSTCGCGSE